MNTENKTNDRRFWYRGFHVTAGFIGRMFVRLLFVVLFSLIVAVLVMWLWNMLMPQIFGLGTISYLQAFGLMILARLLIGTFAFAGRGHRGPRHGPWAHHGHHCGHDEGHREHMDRSVKWWQHYKRFWHEEGRAAFDEYMKRAEKEGEKNETKKDK
jgi:hypothetical protein